MITPEAETVLTAACLAEGRATTDDAVAALLHYFAAYPAAYGKLRAARLDLSVQDGPAQVADAIRWAVAA
jgi:hypothetical protein